MACTLLTITPRFLVFLSCMLNKPAEFGFRAVCASRSQLHLVPTTANNSRRPSFAAAESGSTVARWTASAICADLRPEGSEGDTLKQVEEEYPRAGRGGLKVKDVGRLLLRCADRPGLVAAVSAFLAGAGANIVSLDQHATEQSGGTFMQRTIFNLPGLTAARDALERDFREQVASRFDMDFRLTEAAQPQRIAIMA
jgi:predicted amino acid-binding ACT domain protein